MPETKPSEASAAMQTEDQQPLARTAGKAKARGRRKETRETILAATKELVARKGPHATTVRDITQASGANVAAVNYYFQSKDNLVEMAVQEITMQINGDREARLEALVAAAGDAPLPPRAIMEALLFPINDASRAQDGGSLYVRNVFQMRTVPYAADNREALNRLDRVAQKFITQIARSLPQLSRQEAVWRYELVRGAALHMAANVDPLWRRFELLENGAAMPLPEVQDIVLDAAFIRRVIDTLLPVLEAP